MKSMLKLTLACMAFTANAADIEASIVKNNAPAQQDITLEPIDYAAVGQSLQLKPSKKHKNQTTMAAAQDIQYFEVVGVYSAHNGGWEYPTQNQTSTQDHGGNPLVVVVGQVGLGNANQARLDGVYKSPYKTDRLCGSDYHLCRSGETITGFYYYYDFTGQNYGSFNASANSVATPFGYWSDSIYIN